MSDLLLHRLALKIRQSLDLDEILNKAVIEVRQMLGTDRVLLYKLNEDGTGQVVVESVDPEWPSILGEVIEDSCFSSGWDEAYRQGRVSAVSDIHNGSIRACHAKMLAQYSVWANLVVPLLQTSVVEEGQNPDHLWGLLIAHHCAAPRQWTEDEQNLLQQLATHLAIAIQQAEQHQQLRHELAERLQIEAALRQSQQDYQALVKTLEARVKRRSSALAQQSQKASLFAEIALRIRQSLKLEDILQSTVQEVQNCLKADRVLIYQVFADGTGKTISEAVLEGFPQILAMTFPEEVFPEDYRERYRQGRVAAIEDVHSTDQPLTECLVEFVEQWAVKAKLIVPILQSREAPDPQSSTEDGSTTLWGLLIAHQCVEPRAWTDFEIELCRGLADQVSLAIAQANFTQSLESRVTERTAQLTESLQATAASEEKFRQLAENISEVFLLQSKDFKETFYVSPAFETLFGQSCERLYQDFDVWLQAVHGGDRAAMKRQLRYQQEHWDENVTMEYRIVLPEGSIRWILMRLFPIRAENGEVQRIAGIAEDVSDRKQAEEAFKRSSVSRSLVGDILRDLQSQAQISPTAMFQSGQALAQRLKLKSLSKFLETFSLMGLGSLALVKGADSSSHTWQFSGEQLVEVKAGSHSPTCHYARGFLCGAIAQTAAAPAPPNLDPLADQPSPKRLSIPPQAAAVEMSCCSMGDSCCQFVVQLVEA